MARKGDGAMDTLQTGRNHAIYRNAKKKEQAFRTYHIEHQNFLHGNEIMLLREKNEEEHKEVKPIHLLVLSKCCLSMYFKNPTF